MTTIKFKRGTSSTVQEYTDGKIGEPILDIDNNRLYLGQGTGNKPVPLNTTDSTVNDIGVAGGPGFPGGVCDINSLPEGFTPLSGYNDKTSPNYGNYQFEDGSIMCYRPQTWIKISTGNQVDIKPASYFVDESTANAAGYFCHDIFKDGGVIKKGIFVDKYMCSKNAKGTGYIASSIKNGLPISTHADHNPIADLTACSTNAYHECLVAPKARDGVDGAVSGTSIFFCIPRQLQSYIALCSLAHGQASTSSTYCAWYDAAGITNFPKGCNDQSLGDHDDSQVKWEADGFSEFGYVCGKTGSAGYGGGAGNVFAKSTDNGQDCGIADVNGLMFELNIGLTCISTTSSIENISRAANAVITITSHGILGSGDDPKYIYVSSVTGTGWSALASNIFTATYVDTNNISIDFDSSAIVDAYDSGVNGGSVTSGTFYKKLDTVKYADFTSGTSLPTDHWGTTGIAAMMEEFTLSPIFTSNANIQRYGSGANQVLSTDLSGNDFELLQLGLPLLNGLSVDGTNLFGKDEIYLKFTNNLFVNSCGYFGDTSKSGIHSVDFQSTNITTSSLSGFRCACYSND